MQAICGCACDRALGAVTGAKLPSHLLHCKRRCAGCYESCARDGVIGDDGIATAVHDTEIQVATASSSSSNTSHCYTYGEHVLFHWFYSNEFRGLHTYSASHAHSFIGRLPYFLFHSFLYLLHRKKHLRSLTAEGRGKRRKGGICHRPPKFHAYSYCAIREKPR
jgi:hypothetical protein